LPCTKAILQAGVKKIYYLNDYRNNEYAMELIKHVGVEVEQVQLEPKYFEKLSFGELHDQ
jgi:dCMP deaminase